MSVTIVTTDEKREERWCPQFRLKLNKRAFVQNELIMNLQMLIKRTRLKTKRTQLKAKTHASHDVPRRPSVARWGPNSLLIN